MKTITLFATFIALTFSAAAQKVDCSADPCNAQCHPCTNPNCQYPPPGWCGAQNVKPRADWAGGDSTAQPTGAVLTTDQTWIYIANHSDQPLVAITYWVLVDGKAVNRAVAIDGLSLNPLIPAKGLRREMALRPKKFEGQPISLELDAAIYADGSIQGPDTWRDNGKPGSPQYAVRSKPGIAGYVQLRDDLVNKQSVHVQTCDCGVGHLAWQGLKAAWMSIPGNVEPEETTDLDIRPDGTILPYPYIIKGPGPAPAGTWAVLGYLTIFSTTVSLAPSFDTNGYPMLSYGCTSPGSIDVIGEGSCPLINYFVPGLNGIEVMAGGASNCLSGQPTFQETTSQLYGYQGPASNNYPSTAGYAPWPYMGQATGTVLIWGAPVYTWSMGWSCAVANPLTSQIGTPTGACPPG